MREKEPKRALFPLPAWCGSSVYAVATECVLDGKSIGGKPPFYLNFPGKMPAVSLEKGKRAKENGLD